VGNPVFDVLEAARLVAEVAVVVDEMGLGLQTSFGWSEAAQRRRDQADRELLAAAILASHDPPDLNSGVGVEKTDVGRDPRLVLDPDMLGVRLKVSTVDLGVRTVLLDDENVDSQSQDRMQLLGRDLSAHNNVLD